jgi:hypothetical protein
LKIEDATEILRKRLKIEDATEILRKRLVYPN